MWLFFERALISGRCTLLPSQDLREDPAGTGRRWGGGQQRNGGGHEGTAVKAGCWIHGGSFAPFCLLCILTFSRIKSLFFKKRKNYRCRCRRVSTAKITRGMKNSQAIRNSHRWTHPPNEANGESCGRFFYVFFPSSSFF